MAKNRFPYLEMLRADISRRDAAITAPLRAELTRCHAIAAQLQASLRSLQKFVGSAIAKDVIAYTAQEVGRLVRRQIEMALMKAGAAPGRTVLVKLDPADVCMMDEHSLQRAVLRQYLDAMPSTLGVTSIPDKEASATILDIRIPAIGCRQVVQDAA